MVSLSISQRQFVVKSWQVEVSLFETTYPFQASASIKEEVETRCRRNARILWKLVIFLLPSVNVGSSSSVNGGGMIYSLSTFSESW